MSSPPTNQSSEGCPPPPTNTTTKRSNDDAKSKKKKPEPPGPFFKFIVFCVFYYIAGMIVTTLASSFYGAENEDSLSSFENLFTPEDSSARNIVNLVQFSARSSLVLVGLGVGCLLLFFGGFCLLGGIAVYCFLSAPLAEFENIKHKPSILILPAIGIPIGYFLLWPGIDNGETGEEEEKGNALWFLQWLVADCTNYGYLMTCLLFLACVGLYKLGEREDKRIAKEKKEKEEKEAKSLAETADKLMKETKVGEMTFEDGSKQDISAKDAVNVVKSVTRTKEERLAEILKEEENIYFKLSRVAFGILYGFFLGFMLEIGKLMFWPPISAVFFGDESFLLTFLWEGFRKAKKLTENA